jgi:hypothetical protein
MYEIHAFTATAVATSASSGPYRPGDRHSILALVRQGQNSESDWSLAEYWIKKAGWDDIEFERSGTLVPENVSGAADYLVNAFESAIHNEFGFVVYQDVLPNDDSD